MSGPRFPVESEAELRAAARTYWQYGTDPKAQYVITHLNAMVDRLTAERDALQAKVDAVRAVHRKCEFECGCDPYHGDYYCSDCLNLSGAHADAVWPCATVRALGETKEGKAL